MPANENVVDQRTGGLNTQFQNYLESLENAKVTEDFNTLTQLDPGSSTLSQLITEYEKLRVILQGT